MRVNYSISYSHSQRSNIAYLLLSLLLSSLHSPLIISHLSSLPQWTMTTCYAAGLWIDVESWIVESVMSRMESISDRERNRKNVNYGVNESPCGRTDDLRVFVCGGMVCGWSLTIAVSLLLVISLSLYSRTNWEGGDLNRRIWRRSRRQRRRTSWWPE